MRGEFINRPVSRTESPQNEPSVAASLRDPRIIIATANDYSRGDTRTALYRSSDGGRSFSRRLLPVPDGFDLTADGMVDSGLGQRFLVTAVAANRAESDRGLRARDGTLIVYPSADGGRTFDAPVIVGRGRGTGIFHDKPFLAIDKSARSPYAGTAYLSYTLFLRRWSAGVAAIQRSDDGGQSWSAPVALTGRGVSTQGSAIAVGRDGQLYVSWIDLDSSTAARFRLRRSDDGGRSFAPAVTVAEIQLVPTCRRSRSGDCLPVRRWRFRTPTFSFLGVDTSGGSESDTVYALWQEMRHDQAEIWLSRSQDGGERWSDPTRVSGDGQAVLPNMAVDPESGDVRVVYYGNELSRPPGTLLDLYVAESPAGGRRFTRRRVSSRSFSPNADPFFGEPSRFIGDYIGIAPLPDGGFITVWTDTRTGNQDIFAGTPSKSSR